MGAVLFLLLLFGNAPDALAETTGICPLTEGKAYKYDLDGDGKKESVQIKSGKKDDDRYYEAYIYIDGKRAVTAKEPYGFYSVDAQILIMDEKNVFIYLTPYGDNDDGSKVIYQYKDGKLKKSIDLESLGRYANVEEVSKNKITMRIRRTWSAIGCFSYKCSLVCKNGKLEPETKTYALYSYSPTQKTSKPYLTAKNNMQLYESHNTDKKTYVLKKGQKVKITKYYFNGSIHMFQIKTKSGKKGWILAPNDYEELFEEAYGVG